MKVLFSYFTQEHSDKNQTIKLALHLRLLYNKELRLDKKLHLYRDKKFVYFSFKSNLDWTQTYWSMETHAENYTGI